MSAPAVAHLCALLSSAPRPPCPDPRCQRSRLGQESATHLSAQVVYLLPCRAGSPLKRTEAGDLRHRLAGRCGGKWVVGMRAGRGKQPDGLFTCENYLQLPCRNSEDTGQTGCKFSQSQQLGGFVQPRQRKARRWNVQLLPAGLCNSVDLHVRRLGRRPEHDVQGMVRPGEVVQLFEKTVANPVGRTSCPGQCCAAVAMRCRPMHG
jgi:hypothetical protein